MNYSSLQWGGNLLSPFHLNDWEFKRFTAVCLSLLSALLILVALSPWSLYVMLARYLVGIAYCLVIPGALILRVFKIHKLPAIESLSLTVGLSIAFVMFAGFVINLIYPQVGLLAPISTTPVLATFTISTLFLLLVCYFRDREFSDPVRIDIREHVSAPLLALFLVPFLSIFGTYIMNYYNNNWLLFVLLFVVALIILYVSLSKPRNELYPVAVFIISISLLFFTSLISSHLVGWDIQIESYISSVVIQNAHWNPAFPGTLYNSALSLTTFVPILSLLSGLDLTSIYKIIFPLLYSLVPLGLYALYRRQTNEKIAFVSAVFFMSSYVFFVIMPQLAKQEIAEIFVVVFLLLIFNIQIRGGKRALLLIISMFSIVVSHYGTADLFALVLFIALAAQYVGGVRISRSAKNQGYVPEKKIPILAKKNKNGAYLTGKIPYSFILLFLFFLFAWQLFAVNTGSIIAVSGVARSIFENLGELFNPNVVQGASLLQAQQSTLLHEITRYLYIISQVAIVLGLAVYVLKISKKRFDSTYVYMSIAAFGLLVASITLPYFASALNTIRIYHFALLFLSVFFVVGWVGVTDLLHLVRLNVKPSYLRTWKKCLSVFLVVTFLFNSGIIYEIAHDNPESFSLNTSLVYPIFTDGDVSGAAWIAKTNTISYVGTTDNLSFLALANFGLSYYSAQAASSDLLTRTYVFFAHFDKGNNKLPLTERANNMSGYNYTFLQNNLYRIYDNGDSQIYS
jgi:uncharacterized membrane protein